MSVLGEVLEQVETRARAGRLPIVVLDLDSTVFDTAARHLRILRDFAGMLGDPVLEQLAAELDEPDFGWGVDDPVRARGFTDERVLSQLISFWDERFFTSEYCLIDRAAPGAPAFARSIVDRGGLVYYLTGRPGDAMADGTIRALRNASFPTLRGRTVLHMKPNSHLADHRFKRGAIDEIRSLHGEVVCTAENEPAHANLFREAFPEGRHLLYGDVHSPGAPEPHPELVRIAHFHL